ncbi:MAG: rhodanese-like domain-containing protein [Bacteroidota bacterium]
MYISQHAVSGLHSLLIFAFVLIGTACTHSQAPAVRPELSNQQLDEKLQKMLDFDIPLIGAEEVKKRQGEIVLFDTRERPEYETSHIAGARHIGYRHFDETQLADIDKDAPIVLYCSVGYRSEKIGQKLRKAGYQNVYNLYGSIFNWADKGYPLVNHKGEPTKSLHTYNQRWGRWVERQDIQKVW